MKEKTWKRLKLYQEPDEYSDEKEQVQSESSGTESEEEGIQYDRHRTGSAYLIACDERARAHQEEIQKELLYDVLGPVFFGKKQAESTEELERLYQDLYGIDVRHDFCEGDEHYEEYREASQAIAEGMTVYGGKIVFEDSILAELAEQVWKRMEEGEKQGFRRINTMLEE